METFAYDEIESNSPFHKYSILCPKDFIALGGSDLACNFQPNQIKDKEAFPKNSTYRAIVQLIYVEDEENASVLSSQLISFQSMLFGFSEVDKLSNFLLS